MKRVKSAVCLLNVLMVTSLHPSRLCLDDCMMNTTTIEAKAVADGSKVSAKAAQAATTGTSQAQSLVCAQSLGVCERDIRGRCPVALVVGDYLHAVVRPYADAPANSPDLLLNSFTQATLISIFTAKQGCTHTQGCKDA